MKKIIYILLFSFISVFVNAQVTQYLGALTTTIEVRGNLKVNNSILPPTDTSSTAVNGSSATKNGILYYKNSSGKWTPVSIFVDVRSFGAIGNGIHDDAPAFALAATNSNTTVIVPPGTYRFSSQLGLNASGVQFLGYGPSKSKIISDTLVKNTIFIGYNTSNITIKDLYIENQDTGIVVGNRGNAIKIQLDTAFDGVTTRIDTNINIINCEIVAKKGVARGIVYVSHRSGFGGIIRNSNIIGNYIHNCGGPGIEILGEGNTEWFSDINISNNRFENLGLKDTTLGFGVSVSGMAHNIVSSHNTFKNFWVIGCEYAGPNNSSIEYNNFSSHNPVSCAYTFNAKQSPTAYNNIAIGNKSLDTMTQLPYIINQDRFTSISNSFISNSGGLYVDSVRHSLFQGDRYINTNSIGPVAWFRNLTGDNDIDNVHFVGATSQNQLILLSDSIYNNNFTHVHLIGVNTLSKILFSNDSRSMNNTIRYSYYGNSKLNDFELNIGTANQPGFDEVIDSNNTHRLYPHVLKVNGNLVTTRSLDSLGIGTTTPDGRLSVTGQVKTQIINADPTITSNAGVASVIRQQTTGGTNLITYNYFGGYSVNSSDSISQHYGFFLNTSNPIGTVPILVAHGAGGGALPNVTNYTGFLSLDATVSGNFISYVSNATKGANKYTFYSAGGASFYNKGTLVLGNISNTNDSANILRVGGKTQLDSSVTIKNLSGGASTDSLLTDSAGVIRHIKRTNGSNIHIVSNADYTIASTDYSVIVDAQTADRTLTLPDPTTNLNRVIFLSQTSNNGSFNLNLSRSIYETLSAPTSALINGAKVAIQSDGTRWWVIMSRL